MNQNDPYYFNLKDNEKRLILEAINFAEGNMTYAKDILGISKASLYFLVKKHKISYDVINDIREYHGNKVLRGWKKK